MVWDREFGFLREILVAPLGRTGIVFGKAVGAVAVALLQVALMLAHRPARRRAAVDLVIVLSLVPIVVVLSRRAVGTGHPHRSCMRSQQGFQLLIQLLIFPLIFLAGVFFPINGAGMASGRSRKFNPLTYGVDAIRQIFLGSQPGLGVSVFGQVMTVPQEFGIIAIFAVVLLSAAVWAFGRQE